MEPAGGFAWQQVVEPCAGQACAACAEHLVQSPVDLHEATVYYTVYGSDEEKTGTAAALESAKGVLRSEIGRQTGVRFTPTLTFVADAVPENAAAIEDLLHLAAQADAEVHEQAAQATYAGDADPYKKPRDLDDDLEDEDDDADDDADEDDEDDEDEEQRA